jgi:hypothetical protein
MMIATGLAFVLSPAARAQYTVEHEGSFMRGHLWLSEGAAGVFSSNRSAGHRLRIGGELQLGEDYRFILGWTFLDRIFSGEKSTSAGDISRRGTDFNFGYFILPDTLWAMYSLHLDDVSGSAVIGNVTAVGHQASVGYRFYTRGQFNMAVEGAYLFITSYQASTFDFTTNVSSSVKFPAASVWSLNLRVGFDIGGH